MSTKWYLRLHKGRRKSVPECLSKYWEILSAEKWPFIGEMIEFWIYFEGWTNRICWWMWKWLDAYKLHLLGEIIHGKIMSQWWLRLLWRLSDIIYTWSSYLAWCLAFCGYLINIIFLSVGDLVSCEDKKAKCILASGSKAEVQQAKLVSVQPPSALLQPSPLSCAEPAGGLRAGTSPRPGPLAVSPAPSLSELVTVRLHSFPPLEAAPLFFPFRNFVLSLYFSEYCSLWPDCLSLPGI